MAGMHQAGGSAEDDVWPSLPLREWKDTYDTLHMWTQIAGKIRLAQSPMQNHWWQVPLYVTPRGLTTSSIPYGTGTFAIDFDFIGHQLRISTSDGQLREIPLEPRSVADFYRETMAALRAVGIQVKIWTTPVEAEHTIPFEEDEQHASYDAEHAHRWWRVLLQADRVMQQFRSRFIGKCSPVQFFWGSFDLAVTRFSGRRAPEHPGGVPNLADYVVREAYSHEVSSCGFWPGSGAVAEPAFFAYTYPEPKGFGDYPVGNGGAFYSDDLREFILPYDAVRGADAPEEALLGFLQSTYEAGAVLGEWDRPSLERIAPGHAGRGESSG